LVLSRQIEFRSLLDELNFSDEEDFGLQNVLNPDAAMNQEEELNDELNIDEFFADFMTGI
jgi:hypothetical protein